LRTAAARVETSSLVKMRLVGAQRVQGDIELTSDLWPGELGVEEPQNLDFALAQRAGQCLFG
jgi:hypothetical protein